MIRMPVDRRKIYKRNNWWKVYGIPKFTRTLAPFSFPNEEIQNRTTVKKGVFTYVQEDRLK